MFSGRSRVGELKAAGKPFQISKRAVWEAWEKVKANKGAPRVDGQTIEDFELDLKINLYRIWNRMSSGWYLPPPVRAVEIAKAHGGGTRILGVPAVADRVAQTVVALVSPIPPAVTAGAGGLPTLLPALPGIELQPVEHGLQRRLARTAGLGIVAAAIRSSKTTRLSRVLGQAREPGGAGASPAALGLRC
jgi:hypothetical protein